MGSNGGDFRDPDRDFYILVLLYLGKAARIGQNTTAHQPYNSSREITGNISKGLDFCSFGKGETV